MRRFPVALLVLFLISGEALRAEIPGLVVSTPILDAEVHPQVVVAASNGNVWFLQQSNLPGSIGFFTPAGHVVNFPVPCNNCANGDETIFIWDLAADPDGSVWFIDRHAKRGGTPIDSSIGHLTASGQFTFFEIPTKEATQLVPTGHSSLALASDGTVWFTEHAAFKIGKLTPSTRSFTEYPLEMPEQPGGITVGPNDSIWYTVLDHEIAHITSSGEMFEFALRSGANPFGITTGSDGNLWFTEMGADKIGRVTPSGVITEFPLPQGAAPARIVGTSHGTLWYTQSSGSRVGRITLNGSSPPLFESIATPGQENLDITVSAPLSPGGSDLVYLTSSLMLPVGETAAVYTLSLAGAQCAIAPSIAGRSDFTVERTFHQVFSITGRNPLNVSVQGLPASWSAQTGAITIIDSGVAPAVGTYSFTIAVTDGDGCSTSKIITVRIANDLSRRHTVKH